MMPRTAVAVLHGIGDHAHGEQVVNLINTDALAQQFLVDAEQSLDAAFDPGSVMQLLSGRRSNTPQRAS